MTSPSVRYKRHRFPPAIIAHAVWLYFRFPLSLRLVEEMLHERGIVVSYETVRRWAMKFGRDYARPPQAQESEPPRYLAPRRGRRHRRRRTALVVASGRSGRIYPR